jgi:hypothetical protein
VLLSEAQWCFSACGKAIMPNEMTERDHERAKSGLSLREMVHETSEIVSEITEILNQITEIVSESTESVTEVTQNQKEMTQIVCETIEMTADMTYIGRETTEMVGDIPVMVELSSVLQSTSKSTLVRVDKERSRLWLDLSFLYASMQNHSNHESFVVMSVDSSFGSGIPL